MTLTCSSISVSQGLVELFLQILDVLIFGPLPFFKPTLCLRKSCFSLREGLLGLTQFMMGII